MGILIFVGVLIFVHARGRHAVLVDTLRTPACREHQVSPAPPSRLATMSSAATPSTNAPMWVALRGQPARNFYPCHIDNSPFDVALKVFRARSTRLKATIGAPRAARQFMLRLPSRRYAIVTNYDDFPYSLEFSLEITYPKIGRPRAHMDDLLAILAPLGLPLPDKSNDGVLKWLPPSEIQRPVRTKRKLARPGCAALHEPHDDDPAK